jgi:putative methionine-R-sulfoxide reductase with GAF domain
MITAKSNADEHIPRSNDLSSFIVVVVVTDDDVIAVVFVL